jgi:putative flippase GtrA
VTDTAETAAPPARGVDVAGVPELPGQALAVAIALPANFVGNRLWTFGSDER